MFLNIVAVIVAQAILFILVYLLQRLTKQKGDPWPTFYRLTFTLSLIVSQGIFIYLLIRFQKPFKKNVRAESSMSEATVDSRL